MDFGVVGIFALVMAGGFALGMFLSLLRPRDQEAGHAPSAGGASAGVATGPTSVEAGPWLRVAV